MSSVLDSIKNASDYVHHALTPLDTDGASATSGAVSSAITSTQDAARAMTALGVADVPAIFDAIKNLNGVGIDDRKFLVRAA
jgi:linoleate 10R-lipoxygenase